MVELAGYNIAMALPQMSHAASLRKVLSQQAVEVFIAAALPWMMRVGEVAANARSFFQCLVTMKLRTIVPIEGCLVGQLGHQGDA
jgi:hypothetical protein